MHLQAGSLYAAESPAVDSMVDPNHPMQVRASLLMPKTPDELLFLPHQDSLPPIARRAHLQFQVLPVLKGLGTEQWHNGHTCRRIPSSWGHIGSLPTQQIQLVSNQPKSLVTIIVV